MEKMFEVFKMGNIELPNRFIFPPIKLAYGNPDGTVTDRQLTFYREVAQEGPGLLILEPVSVTPEGKEHPKQLCVHLPESGTELKKIVDVIHGQERLACLHLNHAGAAANPMATKTKPKAPSSMTCQASGQESETLNGEEIKTIIAGYRAAAQKAAESGFDADLIALGRSLIADPGLIEKWRDIKDSEVLAHIL